MCVHSLSQSDAFPDYNDIRNRVVTDWNALLHVFKLWHLFVVVFFAEKGKRERGEREGERVRERGTDRQTDRQTETDTDRDTDRQRHTETDR